MRIGYIVYYGMTWLDLIGVYDPISRLKSMNYLPDITWEYCSFTQSAADIFGLAMKPDRIKQPITGYDVIIIPGGPGVEALIADEAFKAWIQTAADIPCKISICTGSLILGAAGFLKEKKATTNFLKYDSLKPYCREISEDRIVDEGDVITAGAVSSSLDLGLYLCEKWSGAEAKEEIRKRMDYKC